MEEKICGIQCSLSGATIGGVVVLLFIVAIIYFAIRGPPENLRKLLMKAKDDSRVQFDNSGFDQGAEA